MRENESVYVCHEIVCKWHTVRKKQKFKKQIDGAKIWHNVLTVEKKFKFTLKKHQLKGSKLSKDVARQVSERLPVQICNHLRKFWDKISESIFLNVVREFSTL
jgi:hypothetical protein